MRIGVISGSQGWHVRDLLRAGPELGLALQWHDATQFALSVAISDAPPFYQDLQALIIRTFPSGSLEQAVFRLGLLHRAEREGLLVVNSPGCFEACVDKFTATSRLSQAGLPVPPTYCCQHLPAALEAFDQLGGDIVLKPIFGSEGKGLRRITKLPVARDEFAAWLQRGCVLYMQQFIDHPGYDLRVFVLGGKVLAAMKRFNPTNWRTNLAQGAIAQRTDLQPELEQLALRAAGAVLGEAVGVDLLPDRQGRHYVLEVNGAPGWKGLSAATGIDVAACLLAHVVRRINGR